MAPPNVIIFGETGAGKSSVVNLLADNYNLSPTSSGSVGRTLESKKYPVQFDGTMYMLHDTAGLDEGDKGAVAKQDAIVNLYRLLRELESGVSLLVFCMRPKIKDSCVRNWKLFYEIICQKKVPVVLAIMGLEEEENMDDWWDRNAGHFVRYDMVPNAVACITGTKGKYSRSREEHTYQKEYNESREKIRDRVRRHHSNPPWRVERAEWFKTTVELSFKSTKGGVEEIKTNKTVFGAALKQLIESKVMGEEEARRLAEALKEI